ncbi:hypothetical protein RSAG8_07669, partial [Rhizoctonia solani AG-8 WAC10335]
MPKRARGDKALSTPVANDIIYHNESTILPLSQTTTNIHWFDESRPLLQPLVEQRTVGQRRKSAPRKMTFKVGNAGRVKHHEESIVPPGCKHGGTPSIAAEYQPDLEGGWEDVDEPGVTQTQAYAPGAAPERVEKNPNYYLRLWLKDSCDTYVRITYERDAPPRELTCNGCNATCTPIYRCTSCISGPHMCGTCLVTSHRHLPTHRPQEWTGTFWHQTSLADLGLIIYLGHEGTLCETNVKKDKVIKTSTVCVGDMSGFVNVRVQYCNHDKKVTKAHQLLKAGLFPCTDITPKSAFTMSLLDTYNTFATLGRTSAHKFYLVLERLTKPGFPKDVKDRYRELIYTHRRFLHVLNLRRTGHLFNSHPSELKPGDQALPCGFCPRPGYNFEWSEVDPKERVWFRFPVSYDGNVRSVRKDKKVDTGDIALSDGLGYSLEKAPAKEWTKANRGMQRTEKPKCDHHKAGNDTSVRFLGRDITGMGAFTCASHGCFIPGGTVDFHQGELFIYAELGFAGFYKYMTMGGELDILMTYDVMCHWIVKFRERAKNLPAELAIPPELNLVVAIPKWHLAGHNPECYVRYSLDHTQHAGRIDGEGPERVWAHQNESSGSTSEQGPGMRTDSVNNIGRDWNFELQCRLRENLPTKYRKALAEFLKQKSVHEDLTKTFDKETITKWESQSLEPFQDAKGNWLSPLMDPIFTNGNFQSSIQSEKEKEAPTARVAGRRPGATRWLSSGIELEHNFQNTREKHQSSGDDPTRRQKNDVDRKRLALRDRMVAHETKRTAFMGETEAPDHPDYSPIIEDWMENTMVIMPSSFTPETIGSAGLSSLGELEAQLRRAMCRDALESLRELLGAKAFALNYKSRQARGQGSMTRARATIKSQSDQIQKTRWRYNNSRDALIRLGHIKDDDEVFKVITDNDTRTLKEYIEETSRGVGQGHAVISWIWRNTVVRNDGQWEINVLRTEWFRSRERYKRWQEQLVLLKREMVMGIRSNLKQREIWKWKAEQPSATAGMASYALARSEWFGKFAASLYKAFRKYLKDGTVELEWCSTWLANHVNEDGLIL